MKVRLRADVSAIDTDDGLVLLDERSGKYYQLNSSGAIVLRALLEDGSEEAAVRTLCERFPHQTTASTPMWPPSSSISERSD